VYPVHVRLLDNLPNGVALAQEIVAGLILPVTEILAIEDHKLNNTFLHVAFGSQILLKPTSDQTGSDTNGRTREGDQRGVNEIQSKFLIGTCLISQNRPDAILF
jgi:hypothetical protein